MKIKKNNGKNDRTEMLLLLKYDSGGSFGPKMGLGEFKPLAEGVTVPVVANTGNFPYPGTFS